MSAPFTVDRIRWSRDDHHLATVTWWLDEDEDGGSFDTVVRCELVDHDVPGRGAPIYEVTVVDGAIPPDNVDAAIRDYVTSLATDHFRDVAESDRT